MGEPRDPHHIPFLPGPLQLSKQLLKLYKKASPSTREFQCMGYEIEAFFNTYLIIKTYLHPPSAFISDAGSELVAAIYNGFCTICDGLTSDVRALKNQLDTALRTHQFRVNWRFSLHGGKPTARDQDKRAQRFFAEKKDYDLERCQLRYGNGLLKLILAVLVYSQNIHDTDSASPFPDQSMPLVANLMSTCEGLESKERLEKRARGVANLPVEASKWWGGLPYYPPHVEQRSPLAQLAEIWVNYEARWAAHPNPDVHAFHENIRQWREYGQRMEQHLRHLNKEKHDLAQANAVLETDHAELEREAAQLRQDKYVLQRDKDGFQQERDNLTLDNVGLQARIGKLEDQITRLFNKLELERTARRNQEKYTKYYKDARNDALGQVDILTAERDVAEKEAREAREARDRVLREQARERERVNKAESTSTSRSRQSSRAQQGPPMAYETRGHHRRRSSSSSRSHRSSHRSSGSSTVVDDRDPYGSARPMSSPKEPPPIRFERRPFRVRPPMSELE